MRWDELDRNRCPLARGLGVVGDRWTLLILRECFQGVRRFERFQQSLGITRHVLAERLRKLEAAGVLRREPYQQRPPRHDYRLTEAGEALFPVLAALIGWAEAHTEAPEGPVFRLVSRESGAPVRPVLSDAETGRAVTAAGVRVDRAGPAPQPDAPDPDAPDPDAPPRKRYSGSPS